ncbi:MAG: amidase [Nitrospinota bacterium]|nr:MAG: amidase [Nitrospinota bacterium]
MNELIRLTAVEAVDLLARRVVSPLELIEAAVERITAVEPQINALPTLCVDRARAHARKLMEKKEGGMLHGLPIAVKDLKEVAGVRTTYGSPIFADYIPSRSDLMVEILEQRGAVVLAKSNTPEFGAGANTFNEVFGQTRNPWDTRCTCGGSSGGSAAALAAGEVWLATGSDLGGSLRIPASYCGVVGLRPSPGRVPHGPSPLPFSTLAVAGPMGRTVGDVALMLDAMVGEYASDPLSLPAPPTPFLEAVKHPHPPRRVAYSADLGLAPVDQEVAEICAGAVRTFSDLGAEVVEACPDLHDAGEIFQVLRAALFAATKAELLATHRDLLKPEVIWNIDQVLKLTAEEIGRAERARGELYQRTVTFFATHDLLVSPTVIAPPFDVNIRYLTQVAGVEFETYIDWLVLTFAITLTACPALSLPCGFTRDGLPVGLQLVAPPRGEAALLSAAALFEAAHDFARQVPLDPRTPSHALQG